jgi:hypothetical protein
MGITSPFERETAETEALTMLVWLASHEEVFTGFLAQTGASVAEVTRRAGETEFLVSVVEFMLTEDSHILAWAEATGRKPETAMQIRAGLPGGDSWNWT